MPSAPPNGRQLNRPRRVRRLLVILLVAIVVSFAGLLAVAIGYRKPIAESLLLAELRRLTGEAVAVSVTRLDRDHLALRGLQIGDVLQIPRLDARYSPTGLFASRLDAISVSGLRLKGTLDAAGISFGQLDAMLNSSGESTGESTGATSLPMTRLEIDDSRIELATPVGPLIVSLDSRISQTSFGGLEASAELGLEHRLATLNAVLTASGENDDWAGQLSLDAALSGDFGASLHIGDLTFSAQPTFAIERGQVTIRTEECAELRIDRLETTDGPRLTRPLEMCIRSEIVSIDPDGESVMDLVASIEPFSIDFGNGVEVSGEIPELKLGGRRSSDGNLSSSLSVERGYLELSQTIGARGIRLEGSVSPASTSPESETKIGLRIDSLFDSQKPARFTDLNLHANLVSSGSGIGAPIEGPIQFDIEVADAERNVVVSLVGEHDLALGVGHASV